MQQDQSQSVPVEQAQVRLYLAPAAAGKTAYVMRRVRETARNLQATPRVVVPSPLQVQAWRRRLAEAGGAMGVRLLTFDGLHADCLDAADEVYTELSDPLQHRLIRTIVDSLPLGFYAPLRDRPGFVQALRQLIGELKASRVRPDAFSRAVSGLGDEPRLRELAQVYAAYQSQLQERGWADKAGLGWLAAEALELHASQTARDWPLVVVDGFDNFTPVQLTLLAGLARRVGELIITMTGTVDGDAARPAHRRFHQTCQRLQAALGVTPEQLPDLDSRAVPPLVHLERSLFEGESRAIDGAGGLELIEAPDRVAEVRAALRWLKVRLVQDGMRTDEVALLARSMPPYRPFILQTAAELGIPIRLVDGLPLAANPAVAALLNLLRLMLPTADGETLPALPRRLVLEAWRSPYFDWQAMPTEEVTESIGVVPGDAEALDRVARSGRVIGGLAQWDEAFEALIARCAETPEDEQPGTLADATPGAAVRALRGKFQRFVARLTPPAGEQRLRDFVGWLEAIIGADPALQSSRFPTPEEPAALGVVACARAAADQATAARDVAALQALKDVLRGLVWAEEALATPAVDFVRFANELRGAVEAATYQIPLRPDHSAILVADVVQARGIPFRAVAVLGLAEGEFPATLGEDPFLRDTDREQLRLRSGIPLEPSIQSAEVEYFYETVTRPRERLLLTRPRLADNGAPWQASPFWEEVRRLVLVQPHLLTSESIPIPHESGSWCELMQSLAAHSGYGHVRDWVQQVEPARQTALDAATALLCLRRAGSTDSPHDGNLSHLADDFAQRLGPDHTWSGSRLEAYRACPFMFFVGSLLRLEPRAEPGAGLDARQLGSIYHRILEQLYRAVAEPGNLEHLLAALPSVADAILDDAPQREGFRVTAWWAQTRREIVATIQDTLRALAELQPGFAPWQYEVLFGIHGVPPLIVSDGSDSFRLRGVIDRIDRSPDGSLCIVDYKTSSPSRTTNRAVFEGSLLQVPLYALAAREALKLGEPADGFYWHVLHGERSSFTLGRFDGGPQGAMRTAVDNTWEAVRRARAGHFEPLPPGDGCPAYCPAAAFCWHYRSAPGG